MQQANQLGGEMLQETYKYELSPNTGKFYNTNKFGRVQLIERPVEIVQLSLIRWPKNLLLDRYGGLPHWGHELTIEKLRLAQELMWIRVQRYAAANSIAGPTKGLIVDNGFFRPQGTTWGLGLHKDPHGCIDARYDPHGHWDMAIDVSRTRTATTFDPHLKKSSVELCLRQAGLITPWSSESWHFRPSNKLIAEYYEKYPEKNTNV